MTLTITELIDELKDIRRNFGDIDVWSSSNYGDYHNTEQLVPIAEVVTCIPIKEAYSRSGLGMPSQRDEEDEDFDNSPHDAKVGLVCVLRYTQD